MAVFDNLNYSYSEGLKPSLKEYYERRVLENVKPELIHNMDAQKRTLPRNNGKTVEFRRITALPAITKPLIEGVTPEGQTMHETAFTVMIKPYGGHIEITDELDWTHIDSKHQEAADLLSDQAALSLDTISRDSINSGMNVQYVGNNTSRGTVKATDKLTYDDIKKAVRTLRRNNAKKFGDGYFHAIVHPDVVFDLTSDEHWIDVAKMQDKDKLEKYVLGTIYGVKFYESTNAKVFTKAESIYEDSKGSKVTEIAANGPYNDQEHSMTTNLNFSADDARALTGLMVNVQCKNGSATITTPMAIESVDYNQRKIKFRWGVDYNTVGQYMKPDNGFKLVPMGGGASGAPVYSTLVYAQNFYGSVELEGGGRNVEIIIKAPGSSGALDPLNQRGTIAWKVKGFCTPILQDDFGVRIESGASA